MKNEFKSGFVSIIGRPNVGKSTFLNRVVGKKIAIMSDKPHTTRNNILGVYTTDDVQVIFTDTPGIHKPQNELGKRMLKASYGSTKDVELILFMTPANEGFGPGEKIILDNLREKKAPVYLIINKTDLVKNSDDILKQIVTYTNYFPFKEVFPISAKNGDNIPKLLDIIKNSLPAGPMYYPRDMITDNPERFIIAELIREKVLFLTNEEVPHSVAVIIDSMKTEDNKAEIYATIYVLRKSQKMIIIGKQGQMIKKIRELARRDINNLLGIKAHLEIWIKIKKDWTNRVQELKVLGYQDNF